LTRRLTMIQGPPGEYDFFLCLLLRAFFSNSVLYPRVGTGKTTVAGSIAFGFVHQCRSSEHLPKHSKVLATAFSNVGADNLAEQMLRLGLKVVRLGKASAVSESLWEHTLDAAIERNPEAKKAMEDATRATSNLRGNPVKSGKKGASKSKLDIASERNKRDLATNAVKASIEVRTDFLSF
jgi:ATP-dependent RNA/DNA helicase IGHMBP2